MNTKEEMFRGLSVEKFWLPLTQNLIDAHQMAMMMTDDDEKYCYIMKFHEEMMIPLYGKYIDRNTFDRLIQIFIYVMEFIYGDPYTIKKERINISCTVREYFNNIRKNWNVDINKKINEVDNH